MQRHKQKNASIAYTVVLVALTIGLFGLCIWLAASPHVVHPRNANRSYCEQSTYARGVANTTWTRTSIAQRYELANVLSALSFFATPILLVTYYFRKLNAMAFVYGVYQLVHAFGTLTNHLCGCREGLQWDNASVWALLAYMLSVNVLALLPKQACHPSDNDLRTTRHRCRAFLVVFNLVATASSVGVAFFVPTTALVEAIIQGVLFVSLVVFGISVVCKRAVSRLARGMFIASVVLLIVGVTFAVLDTPVCLTPHFGFHALWHIFGGALAMVLYTLYLMHVMVKFEQKNVC